MAHYCGRHLVEMPAHLEDQVATVFDLIAGVLIAEAAALLIVEVEREAQAAVDPTLADLAQPIPRRDKVSAIFAKPAVSEIDVKQFPSLVKRRPLCAPGRRHIRARSGSPARGVADAC